MSRNKNRFLTLCGIFISRISGYARDFVTARYFGASIYTDAFFNAFTIPNLLRGIFAEGNLSSSFIPVFNEELKKSKEESAKLCSQLAAVLFFTTLIVSIAGMIFANEISTLMGIGFKGTNKELFVSLSGKYLRIMFPLLIFISAGALCMGVLNSSGRFFITGIAPAIINIFTIIGAIFFSRSFGVTDDKRIFALCYGTLAGSVCYLIFLAYPYFKAGYKFALKFSFSFKPLLKTIKLMLPGIPGQAIYEMNFIVNRIIASYLKVGSISFLFYANRLYQFPLALFGIGVSTVLLPDAARAVNDSDEKKLISAYFDSLKYMIYFLIPITIFVLLLGDIVVAFVYQRGADVGFNFKTTIAFKCYCIGLAAYAGANISSQIYYSLKDTLSPVKYSSINMAVNIILNIAIVLIWKDENTRFAGLALGNSLSGLIYLIIMATNLKKKFKTLFFSELYPYIFKISTISIISSIAAYVFSATYKFNFAGNFINTTFNLAIPGLICVILYFFTTLIFNVDLSKKIWYNVSSLNFLKKIK